METFLAIMDLIWCAWTCLCDEAYTNCIWYINFQGRLPHMKRISIGMSLSINELFLSDDNSLH